MGNRTPQSRCDRCFRLFQNKQDLKKHRDVKGHKTRLLEQSRYNKDGIKRR